MRRERHEYEISQGTDCITVRRRGESTLRVGTILGKEQGESGTTYYLDRLLLPAGNMDLDDRWSSSGCVSSVMHCRTLAD